VAATLFRRSFILIPRVPRLGAAEVFSQRRLELREHPHEIRDFQSICCELNVPDPQPGGKERRVHADVSLCHGDGESDGVILAFDGFYRSN